MHRHHHHHFICPIIQQYAHLRQYDSRRAGQQGPTKTPTAVLQTIFYMVLAAHSSLPQTASGSVPPFFHGSALYSTHRPRNVRRLYSNRHRCGLKITNDRRIAYSHIDIRSFISELSSRISLYSFKSIKFATIRSTYPSENSTDVVTNGNATNIHRSWLNCLSFGLLARVRDTSPDKKKVQRCCLTIDQYN